MALHESTDDLSAATREMHRALASLMQELEAVDRGGQRIDAGQDEELARVDRGARDVDPDPLRDNLVASLRGGDFRLICGRVASIGYASHDERKLRLFPGPCS